MKQDLLLSPCNPRQPRTHDASSKLARGTLGLGAVCAHTVCTMCVVPAEREAWRHWVGPGPLSRGADGVRRDPRTLRGPLVPGLCRSSARRRR